MTVFPLYYFAPIPWFSAALKAENIQLEVCQHYVKQQNTNRMWIKTTSGKLPLIVPVKHTGERKALKEKRISYDTNWQKTHWKSIETAYRSAPYFEYYEDKLVRFYEKKYVFLAEYLLEIHQTCQQILDLPIQYALTTAYEMPDFYTADFRNAFDANCEILPEDFTPVPYTQVFEGFTPGLSILDLICNEGPKGRLLLKS